MLLVATAVLAGYPAPVVWETNPRRAGGAHGYAVVDPKDDDRRRRGGRNRSTGEDESGGGRASGVLGERGTVKAWRLVGAGVDGPFR